MNKNKLIAFGDSFVEGTFYTNGVLNSPESREKVNFVTQLGERLNYDVVNLGRHANSNVGIFWDLKNYLEKNINSTNEIYLICWTGILRTSKWDTTTQRLENDKYFYDKVENDYHRENYLAYSFIQSAYNLLSKYKKTFYFTSSFLDYKNTWVDELITNEIRHCWIDYYQPNNSLYDMIAFTYGKPNLERSWDHNHRDYSEVNDLINLECHHPNRKGHRHIADMLSERLGLHTDKISNKLIFEKFITKTDRRLVGKLSLANKNLNWIDCETEEEFKINLENTPYRKKLQYYIDNPITYKHNSFGFRGNDVDLSKPFDVYMGCSFTYGVGLHEEHTWPYLVSKEIQYSNYFNIGIPGSGIGTWYSAFKFILRLGSIRKLFAFIPNHPRVEIPIKQYPTAFNVTPQSISTLRKTHSDVDGILRHSLENYLSDEDYLIDRYFQLLFAIRHLCEVNKIEFYGYNLYKHYLVHPSKESIIARDINHPGKDFNEYLAKIFIAKEKNKDQDMVFYKQ